MTSCIRKMMEIMKVSNWSRDRAMLLKEKTSCERE
jgi:hypothetical protein